MRLRTHDTLITPPTNAEWEAYMNALGRPIITPRTSFTGTTGEDPNYDVAVEATASQLHQTMRQLPVEKHAYALRRLNTRLSAEKGASQPITRDQARQAVLTSDQTTAERLRLLNENARKYWSENGVSA